MRKFENAGYFILKLCDNKCLFLDFDLTFNKIIFQQFFELFGNSFLTHSDFENLKIIELAFIYEVLQVCFSKFQFVIYMLIINIHFCL